MNFIFTILSNTFIAFLILISIVVVAHELGHFLVGRFLGIGVEEFAVGFGPKIFSFKIGRTEYRVNWVLLGGYVRFYGADLENEKNIPAKERERSILHAKLYKRMLVSFAGPFANFILSLFIMIFLYSFGVTKQPTVFRVIQNSVAYQGGLRSGDKILSINQKPVSDWSAMIEHVSSSPDKPLQMEIERDQKTRTIVVTPKSDVVIGMDGKQQTIGRIGVSPFFREPSIAPWQDQFFTQIGLLPDDKITAINGHSVTYLEDVFAQIANLTKSDSDISLAKKIADDNLDSMNLSIVRNGNIASIDVNFTSDQMKKWAKAVLAHQTDAKHGAWDSAVASKELTIKSFEPTSRNHRTSNATTEQAFHECGLAPDETIRQINRSAVFSSQIDLYTWLEAETTTINKNISQFKNNSIPVNITTTDQNGKETQYSCFLSIYDSKNELNAEKLTIDFPITFAANPVLYPSMKIKAKNFIESLQLGFHSVLSQSTFIYAGFKKLFSGHVPLSSLGGPIAIAGFAGEAAKAGIETFLMAMSLMSINIGIFNLLPLPMLDGGTLLLQFVELFYRKPIPKNIQLMIARFGLIFLLTLFLFVFYNDIMRLFS